MKRAWLTIAKRLADEGAATFHHGSEALNAGGRLLVSLAQAGFFGVGMLLEMAHFFLATDEARELKPAIAERTAEIVVEKDGQP